MEIQLIKGEFNSIDAIELIAQMIHIKIKYHENKINRHSNEENIKTREIKIKELQKELIELRKIINSKTDSVKVEATIKVDL
jgi:hypothetical protein